jgi:scyllo-inositol 2-dehydrogenase (NADP+)
MTRLAIVATLTDSGLARAVDGLVAHLATGGITVASEPAAADVTLLWADSLLAAERVVPLLERAATGTPLLVVGPTLAANADNDALTDAAGVVVGRPTPVHEIRMRPGPDAEEVAARLDGDVVVRDGWLQLDKVVDDVEVLFTAMTGLSEQPVMTWRPSTGVGLLTVGATAGAVADPSYRRLVHRWVRRAVGTHDGADARIGILGYGAIGHEHSAAIAGVPGLLLSGICDKNPARVAAAQSFAAELRVFDDGDAMMASDDVDLVIVSTPPNTHAHWATRALDAGKHVVVEKPFCLTTAEADDMADAAARNHRALAVYQNRRWDADYLTLKRIIRAGHLGEVFHYESFVGGYAHPCNYWHSDEEISGGAIYDWGSHYIDWMLDLMPQQVEHVTAATHKRVWYDVTNADHSRVTVRFVDGVEAEFVHSDLAAALKPKWYVLGTRGAAVGHWRQERVVGRSAIGTLVEDPLAASESPAALSVYADDGSVTSVAIPPAPTYPFHRELADLLLSGAPMSVTTEGSRRTIAVMEAAAASARQDGRPVTPS